MVVDDDALELFLNRVPYEILSALRNPLGDKYVRALSKKAETTRSHTTNVLQRMETHGLICYREEGRRKYAELTEKGEAVANRCLKLVQTLKNDLSQDR